jgi:type IV secretory pathway VirJ component
MLWAALVLGALSAPAASAPAPPLILEPPRGAGDTLAILYSGDGGWAAADSGIARALSQQGVAVVGIDSLRYFSGAPTPAQASEDLASIIIKFGNLWERPKVVVAGYSFGAGAAPIITEGLPPPVRAKVKVVALISPLAWGSLRFSPSSWLDIAPRGAQPLPRVLASLKPTSVLCLYGDADRASACPTFPVGLVREAPLVGGHHLAGQYRRISDAIVQSLG